MIHSSRVMLPIRKKLLMITRDWFLLKINENGYTVICPGKETKYKKKICCWELKGAHDKKSDNSNVTVIDSVEKFEDSVHQNVIRHVEDVVKEFSEGVSVHTIKMFRVVSVQLE